MTITELIAKLQEVKEAYGDLPVRVFADEYGAGEVAEVVVDDEKIGTLHHIPVVIIANSPYPGN